MYNKKIGIIKYTIISCQKSLRKWKVKWRGHVTPKINICIFSMTINI